MCSQLDGHMFSPGWNPKSSRCHAHKLHGHDQLGHAATWRGTLLATLFADAGSQSNSFFTRRSPSRSAFRARWASSFSPAPCDSSSGDMVPRYLSSQLETWPYLAGKRCMRKFLAYLFLPDATHPLRTAEIDDYTRLCSTGVPRIRIIHPLLSIELSLAHGQQRLEEIFDDNRWWAGGGRLQDVSVHHHHHLRPSREAREHARGCCWRRWFTRHTRLWDLYLPTCKEFLFGVKVAVPRFAAICARASWLIFEYVR